MSGDLSHIDKVAVANKWRRTSAIVSENVAHCLSYQAKRIENTVPKIAVVMKAMGSSGEGRLMLRVHITC